MNANLLKEIYPVALFTTLLVNWALVGASTPISSITPLEWSQLLKSPDAKDSCKDSLWAILDKTYCSDREQSEMVSPLYANSDHHQLLTRAETKTIKQY